MLWNLFSSVAAQHARAIALSAGERQLTYAELETRARSLAGVMREAGFVPGDAAALFLPNDFDFPVAALGVMHEGGACLPLSVKFQEQEVAKYLGESLPRLVLTDAPRRALIEKIAATLPTPPQILVVDETTSAPPAGEPREVGRDAIALWQYSTGSTGQSKSVRRSYGNLHAELSHYTQAVRVRPEDRVLAAVPLFHSHGFGNCLLAGLFNGARLELVEAFNPRELQKLIAARGITIFPGVPFMFKMLAGLKSLPGPTLDYSSLRLCYSAGSPLEAPISLDFEKIYGQPVRQLYGTTETGSLCIHLGNDISTSRDSVGRAMAGIEISIRSEHGVELPEGAPGEIWIRSPAMAGTYSNNPLAAAVHFRDGWFAPGDLAERNQDGLIFIRGRKTLFINVGGNKVDPAEVESFLMSFPKITDAAVLGHTSGSGGQLVKAFVVTSEQVEKEQLLAFCQAGLADFKVPKLIEFRSEIPRSPLGKVLRKYLQD